MDPVDRFAKLKDTIRGVEEEAAALREIFLRPGAKRRSNQFEVTVRQQTRRLFQKDLLPLHILNELKYWSEATNTILLVRLLNGPVQPRRSETEPVLIERF